MLNRSRCFLSVLSVFVLIASSPVNAELIKFAFTGNMIDSSANYSFGETFYGSYIVETETPGIEGVTIYTSGDRIYETSYSNAIIDFEMYFADKAISFQPDGQRDLNGYDSNIKIRNDQRFTTYSGDFYYSDRIITTFNDAVGSVGSVKYVQFDWYQSSFNGMPELLTSSEIPTVAVDYTLRSGNHGSISADGDPSILFELTSLEVIPVPIPAGIMLFISGVTFLVGIAGRRR